MYLDSSKKVTESYEIFGSFIKAAIYYTVSPEMLLVLITARNCSRKNRPK